VACETTNGVIITDAQGRVEWLNEGFTRITGYRLADLLGRRLGALLQGADTDPAEVARIGSLLRRAESCEAELVNYAKDGRRYWVHMIINPLFDEAGVLEGFIAIESDITDRKRMEVELRQALTRADRFQLALDEHAIVSVTDVSGAILHANQKFEQISGYTRAELLGRNHRLLKSGEHPERYYREMWQTISAGKVWHGTLCNRRKDGGVYWVESTIVPFLDENGLPYKYVSIRTDVTALMEVEASLRAERDFSDAAIDAIPGTFYVLATDGRLLRANESTSRITGYSMEEISRMGALEFFSEADQPAIADAIRHGFETGRVEIQAALRAKDGGCIPFLFEARRFEFGGTAVLVGIGTDISVLKQTEHALLQSEYRLQQSQRYADIGTWDWNIQTGDLYWSERIAPLFGYREGTLETTYENFLGAVHPEDRQRVIEAVNACVERGERYDIEHRCVWPDGSVRWLLERGDVARAADGTPLRMLGVVQDVTDRKRAELALRQSRARLEEAQRIARIGNWEANLQSGELFWSAEIYRIFGYDPVTFTPSVEAFYEAVHPDDMDNVRASERRARDTGVHDVVHRIVRPDGEVRWVRELAELIRDAGGTPVRLVGTVQDVTALKRAESDLIRAKEEAERAQDVAERANRAKSEFLSSMSHELRTPMNAILGFAQLMDMDRGLGAQHRESVAEIRKAGQHLLQLINDVLDLAKVEAGRIDIALEPVSCEQLFRECGRLVGNMALERGVALQVASAPWVVQADSTRLKQALVNLLSNAVKYNRPGGTVWLDLVDGEAGMARLRVRDDGPGIALERQAELFQAFNRLGAERTEVEGTGIGLVITRRLVELMGGRMGIDSIPGAGSTFWIELPRQEAVAHGEEEEARGAAHSSTGSGTSEAEVSVLYVEDNPANLRLVNQLLARRSKVRLISAHSASLGLDLAVVRPPDLILVDINLPGMDGYELLRRLRALPATAHVPVVALTANAMPRDIERGLAAGFSAYLTKPLDVPRFFEVVDTFLARPADLAV
jgi:PAS domain S-box-containing protein